jgi:FKBP-type peptidyl-prolyl cis-trans isomerase
MKCVSWLVTAAVVLGLTGCGQKEAEPEAPKVDPAIALRDQFFGAQAADPGITWRSSGLGIKVITPGEGASPQMSDTVRVQYVGKLKDGRVFDDSHKRTKPSVFVVNQLIAGWAAAMPTMKPGGKAVFFIPPSLGYGGMRAGDIPALSGLIFEVELIAVNPAATPKP